MMIYRIFLLFSFSYLSLFAEIQTYKLYAWGILVAELSLQKKESSQSKDLVNIHIAIIKNIDINIIIPNIRELGNLNIEFLKDTICTLMKTCNISEEIWDNLEKKIY